MKGEFGADARSQPCHDFQMCTAAIVLARNRARHDKRRFGRLALEKSYPQGCIGANLISAGGLAGKFHSYSFHLHTSLPPRSLLMLTFGLDSTTIEGCAP